jgi:hypothetical protein
MASMSPKNNKAHKGTMDVNAIQVQLPLFILHMSMDIRGKSLVDFECHCIKMGLPLREAYGMYLAYLVEPMK